MHLLDLWHPGKLLFMPDCLATGWRRIIWLTKVEFVLSYLDSGDWVFTRETNNQMRLLHASDAVKFN